MIIIIPIHLISLSKRRLAINRLRLPTPLRSSLTPCQMRNTIENPWLSQKANCRKTITVVPHSERRKSCSRGPNYNILIPGIRAYCTGLSSLNSGGPSCTLLTREISFMGQWAADQLQQEPGCWKQVDRRVQAGSCLHCKSTPRAHGMQTEPTEVSSAGCRSIS